MQTKGIYTWNNMIGGQQKIVSQLNYFLIAESIVSKVVIIEASILSIHGLDH